MKRFWAVMAVVLALLLGGNLVAGSDAAILQAIRVESLDEARSVASELRAGRSFDELAREHSSVGLRERAGYLGAIPDGALGPRVREALSKLKEGQVSGEIKLEGGYMILRLLRPQEESVYATAPASGRYYLDLGLILGEIRYEEGEIEAYRKAIEMAPELTEAYVNLGEALRAKALRLMGASGKSAAPTPGASEEVVSLLDEAIDQFKLALSLDPGLAEAHWDLGLAYAAEGLLELALLEFQEAIKLRPPDGEMERTLASVYFLKGDYELAKAHALKAKQMGANVDPLMGGIEREMKKKAPSKAQKSR
jgi:tetratricopeptide (TPR) repeat protein